MVVSMRKMFHVSIANLKRIGQEISRGERERIRKNEKKGKNDEQDQYLPCVCHLLFFFFWRVTTRRIFTLYLVSFWLGPI